MVDAARIRAADAEPQNWLSHGRSYDEQRFSPLKSISKRNVRGRKLAFARGFPHDYFTWAREHAPVYWHEPTALSPDGDGFWVIPDAANPDIVYAEYQGGNVSRIDRRTKLARDIQPKAGKGEKLRYNWNTPLALSPNEKGTLYIGAQFLFRSRDRGDTWQRISPDLTTNDPAKQKQEQSGGITVDNSSAEMYTTIYGISESPKNGKVIQVPSRRIPVFRAGKGLKEALNP